MDMLEDLIMQYGDRIIAVCIAVIVLCGMHIIYHFAHNERIARALQRAHLVEIVYDDQMDPDIEEMR